MIRIILFTAFLSLANTSYSMEISHTINKFGCMKLKGSEDYTKECYVSIQLQVNDETQWGKIACYGEVNFKQIYKGEVKDKKEGFLISATRDGFKWPPSFKLTGFIYRALVKTMQFHCKPVRSTVPL